MCCGGPAGLFWLCGFGFCACGSLLASGVDVLVQLFCCGFGVVGCLLSVWFRGVYVLRSVGVLFGGVWVCVWWFVS